MKTITEYQPLIFSHLLASSEKRTARRRQLRSDIIRVLSYSGLGLWLSVDTGFLVWNWQFWMMFAPLMLAAEVAVRAISK